MDQQSVVETQSAGDNSYVFEGQTLLFAATVTVFLFVVLLVGLHMYTRWCLRRGGSARRTRVVVISADNQIPDSASDRGLEAAVLSSLPTVVFSSKAAEQEKKRPLLECAHCAVCLSDFVESEIVRLLPKCNHSFHIECIDMWFHSHSTCPLCRSPVEPAPNRIESSQVVVEIADEEASGPEPGPSSGSGLCATCHHEEGNANVNDNCTTSLARRRKAANGAVMGVKIEVVAEFENELRQSSPVTRLLSFKRLLSMGRKSPAGSGASPRHMAGTSRGATELDLENGLGEPIRVYTPK